jgi:hypothetical protein
MPSDLHDLPEAPVHLGTKMDTKSMPMDMKIDPANWEHKGGKSQLDQEALCA